MPSDYDVGMKKLIWILSAGAAVALVGMVFLANDSASVRIGAWAQFAATLGTIFAAYLAFRTADANRAQAKEANKAMAEATRPELSLAITPNSYGFGRPDPMTPLTLSISNQSKFNVNACQVKWKLPGGTYSRRDLGPIVAHANPSRRAFDYHVSYAGNVRSHEQVDLGLLDMYTSGVVEVIFNYSSTFSDGEWSETHYWENRDRNDNLDSPNWELSHTCDPPKWIPKSE